MSYRTLLTITDGSNQRRLIWITEEFGNKNPGISSGFFGSKLGNTHFTYHDDGLTHHVISPKIVKGKLVVNETRKIPIDNIDEYMQVYFQSVPAPLKEPDILSSEGNGKRTYDKTLTLNLGDFNKSLSLDMSFVRIGKEGVLLDMIKNFHTKHHKLIGLEFIELQSHNDHRIALTLLSSL